MTLAINFKFGTLDLKKKFIFNSAKIDEDFRFKITVFQKFEAMKSEIESTFQKDFLTSNLKIHQRDSL